MVLDDNPAPEPAPRRVIKAMPVPSRAASTKASAGTVPSARPPLGAKRANTSGTGTSSIAVATKKGAATGARAVINKARGTTSATAASAGGNSVQARRIVKEKAEALRKATEEFEDAERAVLQHKAKKAKTSEPDYFYADADDADAKDAGWEDLDEGDEDDPLMVSTYVVEVYDYLRDLEVRIPAPRCAPGRTTDPIPTDPDLLVVLS